MIAHLFWHEVKRNLHPIRALPLIVFGVAIAYHEVGGPVPPGILVDPMAAPFWVQGALTTHKTWLLDVIPLVAGVVGGSLAYERHTGITLSILARGVSRSRYVLSKMLGAAASSALITAAIIGGFYVIVGIYWLPGPPMVDFDDKYPVGPVWALYLEYPVAHDMLCVSMFLAGAAAMPQVGVLAGLITANEYVAMAATPIFTILSTVLMRWLSPALNPERYLRLGYRAHVPHWMIPYAPFLYWAGFSLMIALLCKWIIAKKELA